MTNSLLLFGARITLTLILFAMSAKAGTWYVDGTATGQNNGTSWADAWTSIKAMTGSRIQAGDIVYISGGPTGSTQTYLSRSHDTYAGQWLNVVNGVTYQIGQDPAHNGTAIFDGEGGSYWLAQNWKNVTISGDAGDGKRHFKLKDGSTKSAGNGGYWENTRVTFVDFGKVAVGIDHNPAISVEIDHCYFYIANDVADHCSYAKFSGSAYDVSKFHHNVVYVPRSSSIEGIGADALQWNGSGYSIYNNDFISYPSSTYVGGQHQDGWQSTGESASFIQIYSNRFTDFSNYCIFPEPYLGGFSHMKIFNNICVITRANNTQAIAVSATSTMPANDVLVANNVADGYSIPFTFRNPRLYPDASAWSGCRFSNNLSVNGGTNIIDPNVSQASNVGLSAVESETAFVQWTSFSSTNNYQLTLAASSLIGKGANLSTSFTFDKEFQTRAAVGGWDIGAYVLTPSSPSGLVAPSNTRISLLP